MPAMTLDRTWIAWCILLLVASMAASAVYGEPADPPAQAGSNEAMITLNFPENVELKVLIDYVSRRLGMNILYDEQAARRRVTIRSHAPVPESSLLGLLKSVLKMNDLALVPTEQEGWIRIVAAQDLVPIARMPEDREDIAPTSAVTRVFKPVHVEASQIETVIKPFLTPRGASTIQVADQNLLIVTDYAVSIERVNELVRLIDQPAPDRVIRFQRVEHLEASQLATQVTQLLSAKQPDARAAARRLDVRHDARTNQLIFIGPESRVQEALALSISLDVALDLETRIYQLKVASPERLDRITRELIGELRARQQYKSSIDREMNLLIVTSTADVHAQLARLALDLDVAPTEEQSPIRFYKLRNSTASQVLATIRAIEGEQGLAGLQVAAQGEAAATRADNPAGANIPAGEPGAPPPRIPSNPAEASSNGDSSPGEGQGLRPASQAMHQGLGRVTADDATNSIIVVADPAVQRIYEQLIRMLDRRRPQVLIEVTLVSLDTSGGYSVGVELGRVTGLGDGGRMITFSSFGLSDVSGNDGIVRLRPGMGFNGAVVSSDIAEVVIRALATDGRARVVSAPRILVNDNATGTLTSVNEAPFTSINASDTVATTSFAGFASAGTNITVTPHISEGDHLQLRYRVELSSFTGEGSDGIPPPRQTNAVHSEITIPDGNTIIIGGLRRHDSSQTISKIPFLGDIPLIKHAFRSMSQNDTDATLFVFVRPVILRDDQFEDLKYLSRRDREAAGLASNEPSSEPMLMR